MNPQANQTPGLGLPQPSFDAGQAPISGMPGMAHGDTSVVPGVGAMQLPTQPVSVPPGAIEPIPQGLPVSAGQPQLGVPIPLQGVSGAAADDDSALDEEWVNKAREIVERTHNDPYLQSREISRIKAQYIKVRYNKDIKSSEDQP